MKLLSFLLAIVHMYILIIYIYPHQLLENIVSLNIFFISFFLAIITLGRYFSRLRKGYFSLTSFVLNILGTVVFVFILLANYIILVSPEAIAVLIILWVSPRFVLSTMLTFLTFLSTSIISSTTASLAYKIRRLLASPEHIQRKHQYTCIVAMALSSTNIISYMVYVALLNETLYIASINQALLVIICTFMGTALFD